MQAGELDTLFAWLGRVFPARSVLVIPTELTTFDVLQILEMGASDFLLPPLRRSELLPRVIRQALLTRRGDARPEKSKEIPGLQANHWRGPGRCCSNSGGSRDSRAATLRFLISGESGTGKEIFARGNSQFEPARQPAICSGELRCDPRASHGERNLRLQARRIHWRRFRSSGTHPRK